MLVSNVKRKKKVAQSVEPELAAAIFQYKESVREKKKSIDETTCIFLCNSPSVKNPRHRHTQKREHTMTSINEILNNGPYHSEFNDDKAKVHCGCGIYPLRTKNGVAEDDFGMSHFFVRM